jgi:hypothetical protein
MAEALGTIVTARLSLVESEFANVPWSLVEEQIVAIPGNPLGSHVRSGLERRPSLPPNHGCSTVEPQAEEFGHLLNLDRMKQEQTGEEQGPAVVDQPGPGAVPATETATDKLAEPSTVRQRSGETSQK